MFTSGIAGMDMSGGQVDMSSAMSTDMMHNDMMSHFSIQNMNSIGQMGSMHNLDSSTGEMLEVSEDMMERMDDLEDLGLIGDDEEVV